MKLYCAMIFLTRIGIPNGADADDDADDNDSDETGGVTTPDCSLPEPAGSSSASSRGAVFDSTLSKFKSCSPVSSAENRPNTRDSDRVSM